MMGPKILPMHTKILGHTAQISNKFRTCVISSACMGAQIRSNLLMNTRLQSQEYTIMGAGKRQPGSECAGRVGSLNTATPGLTSETGEVYRKADATEELYGSLNNINSVTTQ